MGTNPNPGPSPNPGDPPTGPKPQPSPADEQVPADAPVPAILSDFAISQIHAGLEIANAESLARIEAEVLSYGYSPAAVGEMSVETMCTVIRERRGIPHPEAI